MEELQLTEVAIARRRRRILDDVTLTMGRGVTVVLGPNGAGKTSLFRVIVGLDRPAAGTVRYAAGTRLGFVPQELELPASAPVGDTLAYAAWLQRVGRRDRDAAVTRALEAVRLVDRRNERCDRLSGGMRRRVALGCALVHDPGVLVLDEPSVGLDPAEQEAFRQLVRAQGETRAVVLSTHVLDEAAAVADRVVVLAQGRVAYAGALDGLASGAHGSDVERLRTGYLALAGALD